MGVVKGGISIADNMTSVLKNIRKEQKSFKNDVQKTKKELKQTWDKKYHARLDNTQATKKMKDLKQKMEPLRKKVVTAVAVKDAATAKVKSVGKAVSKVGKMVAKPTVKVAVAGLSALKGVGSAVAKAGKIAAIGVAAVGAAGAAGLKAIYNGSMEAAKAQIEAETKLGAVLQNVKSIQKRGTGAYKEAKKELMGVASGLQQVGVIGDEVTLAGMQQLATFQLSEKQISTLSGGMTDLLAQQKGCNATQRDAVGIGNLIGKVMNGQTSALSRVGITFTKVQEKALKTGDANKRAAVLAEVLQDNVGGVNKALAKTDQGKIQQVTNAYGDMKEEVGKVGLSIKSKLAGEIVKHLPAIQKFGTKMMSSFGKVADQAIPMIGKGIGIIVPLVTSKIKTVVSIVKILAPVFKSVFKGLKESAKIVQPVFDNIINGFKPLMPQLQAFGGVLMQSVNSLLTAFMPVIQTIVTTIQDLIPTLIPVLSTVITTVTNVLSAAAPVISGLVTGIGTVVKALAPVFSKIFSSIGDKVGNVLEFIGSKMGFIQEVFAFAGPFIADILSTAWTVISPIMDIAIGVFKTVFNVVQRVFPGIQKVLQGVWSVIKPIVEGIGKGLEALKNAGGWIADKLGFGGEEEEPGQNAKGTNNWRGGATWVGENGPELLDVPRGSRILPNKESARLANAKKGGMVVNQQSVVKQTNVTASASGSTALTGILTAVTAIRSAVTVKKESGTLSRDKGNKKESGKIGKTIKVTIAKLADQIVVREEADIDKIADKVAKKIIDIIDNMDPEPEAT